MGKPDSTERYLWHGIQLLPSFSEPHFVGEAAIGFREADKTKSLRLAAYRK
jgi:hypothetical protein